MSRNNGDGGSTNAAESEALFWAEVGHDLRQPLYAAKLMAGALLGEEDAEKRAAIVADLNASLETMEQMLDQTIALGKVQAGDVDIRDLAIADVLEDVAREGNVLAREQGLQLRVIDSSCCVRSDPVLLRRILSNLLGNAIRYTDAGRVLVGCRRRGSDLSIEVWDTGGGFLECEQDAIFEPFKQGTLGRGNSNSGLGLGLSSVRRIANMLGHEIYAKTRPGRGSMFAVVVGRADA